jgi:DNA-binding NarL/FixJ family response regulator
VSNGAGGANGRLSRRESQVAVLIARGLSSRRIGAELGVAERTADKHVERLLRKLQLHSRAAIAAWVAEQRLAGAQLSPRQHEVAALIARGQTNRQIAARLLVTAHTVDTHVERILRKLGLHSRAQIAAWAVEQRLIEQGLHVTRHG